MEGSAEPPTPGPNPEDSNEKIVAAIKNSNKPAITAGEIAEKSGVARKTVYNRIDDVLQNTPDIHESKIGSATAYWAEEENLTSDGGIGSLPDLLGIFFNRDRTSFSAKSDFVDITAGNLLFIVGAMVLNSLLYAAWLFTGDIYIHGLANGFSIVLFILFIVYLYLIYFGEIAFLNYIGDMRKRVEKFAQAFISK